MSLCVLIILEPQMFPEIGDLQVRKLLGEILGTWVSSRVLEKVWFHRLMAHRGTHYDSQESLLRQVPKSDLPTGGKLSFFLNAWEKIWMFGHYLSSEVSIGYNFVFYQD